MPNNSPRAADDKIIPAEPTTKSVAEKPAKPESVEPAQIGILPPLSPRTSRAVSMLEDLVAQQIVNVEDAHQFPGFKIQPVNVQARDGSATATYAFGGSGNGWQVRGSFFSAVSLGQHKTDTAAKSSDAVPASPSKKM